MCHPSNLSELDVIGNRWKIVRELDSGGYGIVYHGENLQSRENVAIKISRGPSFNNALSEEYLIYQALNQSSPHGIPKALGYAFCGHNRALILEYLGPSLDNLAKKFEGHLSLHTVLQLAVQLMDRLEYIHDKGYVHRDIKPNNLLMGRDRRSSVLYLIDFGLAKKYLIGESGMHIEPRRTERTVGTYEYCSVNSHLGKELSRRDDLISVGYLLARLYFGELPWTNPPIQTKDGKNFDIIIAKHSWVTTLNTSAAMGFCLMEYMNCVGGLGFQEDPDYSYLRSIFRTALEKRGLEDNNCFDWDS